MPQINLSKVPYPEIRYAKNVGYFHDYLIKKGSICTNHRGLRTENINSCTAGVLFGKDKNFMFHAAPEMQPLNSIKEDLAQFVSKLNRSCEEIKGFIFGGWALNNRDKETVRSFDLYNTIADALDYLGIKFTMICGKEKNAALDNMYAVGNNVTVWNNDFKKIASSENMSPEEVINLLEQNYQFVENEAGEDIKFIDKFPFKTQHLAD